VRWEYIKLALALTAVVAAEMLLYAIFRSSWR